LWSSLEEPALKKRYVVRLSGVEREQLEGLVKRGREATYRRRHAQVLLRADEGERGNGLIDREVAERVGCSRRTVEQIRQRCARARASRRHWSGANVRGLDGEGEARLVSIACSEPPAGHARWALRLLGDRLVELKVVESIFPETVRQVLKNATKPWQKRMWCILAPANVAFVCQMETILAVYRCAFDPAYPVVRMDETSVQCAREARDPIPAKPG